ncbi:MauE/DoxX family redox-associated membrane protein [Pedobacter nutrimenti]|uniref:MauE/DoxX family redox-associated membrane protein n=1 Tax=Pedobacter nutrimenti TaxID=1241337 RepID=UPI00292DD1CB|nr:MauE/DoxX family redox-associated membrane protein [Pedobacter nutrimenti]
MNFKTKTVIVEVISALFILLFIYASLSKVLDFEKFMVELGKSPILSSLADLMAITVPALELIITGLLFIKRSQMIALYSSFCLMVMFTAYIVGILNFSPYVPCSCGGLLQYMSWNQHLVFNVIFVLLAGIAILIYPINIKDLSAVRGKAETL